jgi:hypothetical protein
MGNGMSTSTHFEALLGQFLEEEVSSLEVDGDDDVPLLMCMQRRTALVMVMIEASDSNEKKTFNMPMLAEMHWQKVHSSCVALHLYPLHTISTFHIHPQHYHHIPYTWNLCTWHDARDCSTLQKPAPHTISVWWIQR